MSHFANEFIMIWQSHTYCSLLTKVIRNSLNFDYRLLLWLKQNTVLSFTIQLHLLLNSTLLHVWPWGKCYSKTVHIIQYVFQMCPLSSASRSSAKWCCIAGLVFPEALPFVQMFQETLILQQHHILASGIINTASHSAIRKHKQQQHHILLSGNTNTASHSDTRKHRHSITSQKT